MVVLILKAQPFVYWNPKQVYWQTVKTEIKRRRNT